MPKYYRIQDVSKSVSRYIRDKGLQTSPNGWRDVYAAEHAKAFTVAKLKDLSLLETVQKEIGHSIEHGDSFEDFQKKMKPRLQKWLDSVRKPVDGPEGPLKENLNKRKDRYRLRRIFETNTRQAYAQHHYQRGMDNSFNTHIIYRLGPSINHRADHVAIDATVLPKDDPFWDTHFPPNGWNCKCYVRFMTVKDVEKARKEGIADLESVDKKTGRFTRNKGISEKRPKIQLRSFKRSDGQDVRVPTDIDPGFEWNPGQMNRGTWLKDQALRKVRALELAPKELQKLEQLIVSNAAQQAAYKDFVDDRYGKNSNGKVIDVGLIHKGIEKDRFQRGGELPSTGLVVMPDRVLTSKNQTHKHMKHGDSSLTKQEFYKVPYSFSKPDAVYWDNFDQQYVFVANAGKRPILMLIQVDKQKRLKGHYWTVRSIFRSVDTLKKMLDKKSYGKPRYTKIKLGGNLFTKSP